MKQGFALFINTEIDFPKGFSFDELVHKTKLLFEAEGMPGSLLMITGAVNLSFEGCAPA